MAQLPDIELPRSFALCTSFTLFCDKTTQCRSEETRINKISGSMHNVVVILVAPD